MVAKTKHPPFLHAGFSIHFLAWKLLCNDLKFHWNVFPMVKLTHSQHWFKQWLGVEQAVLWLRQNSYELSIVLSKFGEKVLHFIKHCTVHIINQWIHILTLSLQVRIFDIFMDMEVKNSNFFNSIFLLKSSQPFCEYYWIRENMFEETLKKVKFNLIISPVPVKN